MLPKRMFLKRRLWFCVGFGAFVVLFQNFVLLMVSIVNNSEESSLFTLEGKKAKPVVHSKYRCKKAGKTMRFVSESHFILCSV